MGVFLVKFLDSLPHVFVERYLKTHGVYLKSIADIIATMYGTPFGTATEGTANKMILTLLIQEARLDERRQDSEGETVEFRNLRNCWYHECALNYPFEDRDERLKFASWKIIQGYYTVFSSIASLVCCYHEKQKSHNKILNLYARDFLGNRRRKAFVLPPMNLYLNQQGIIPNETLETITWQYAHEYKIPDIRKCLETVHKDNRITTIPHYLKSLRDWVTYQDAYLLFRLYGDAPKADLDFSLKLTAFIYCLQTEHYLIRLFGYESLKLQFRIFSTQLRNNLNIKSPSLEARFNAYESNHGLFE